MNVTDSKACTQCGEIKPLDEFCRNNSIRSGRHPACKACEIKRVRAWKCNMAIGLLGDSVERIDAAKEYLARHSATAHGH